MIRTGIGLRAVRAAASDVAARPRYRERQLRAGIPSPGRDDRAARSRLCRDLADPPGVHRPPPVADLGRGGAHPDRGDRAASRPTALATRAASDGAPLAGAVAAPCAAGRPDPRHLRCGRVGRARRPAAAGGDVRGSGPPRMSS